MSWAEEKLQKIISEMGKKQLILNLQESGAKARLSVRALMVPRGMEPPLEEGPRRMGTNCTKPDIEAFSPLCSPHEHVLSHKKNLINIFVRKDKKHKRTKGGTLKFTRVF